METPLSNNVYYNLTDGDVNGQIKKIALHPSYETYKNGYSIDIDIDNFCDPDGGTAIDATLILNNGGQTLNLIWITDGSDGYWMLMDNNFDFI